jgi:hypothetical protein
MAGRLFVPDPGQGEERIPERAKNGPDNVVMAQLNFCQSL